MHPVMELSHQESQKKVYHFIESSSVLDSEDCFFLVPSTSTGRKIIDTGRKVAENVLLRTGSQFFRRTLQISNVEKVCESGVRMTHVLYCLEAVIQWNLDV